MSQNTLRQFTSIAVGTLRFLQSFAGGSTLCRMKLFGQLPERQQLFREPRLASMDLRKAVRYRLRASAVFTWAGGDNFFKGEGATRDMSRCGVYILSGVCPPVGCPVQLNILFSAPHKGASAPRIEIEGTVLRVDHSSTGDKSSGFAVVSENFTLHGSVGLEW